MIYKIKLTDAHNGLRVINRNACEKLINLESSAMAHSTEIAIRVINSKLKFSTTN